MLQNAYFLTKIGFDTAENEPAKNVQIFVKFANFANPGPLPLWTPTAQVRAGHAVVPGGCGLRWTRRVGANFWQIFDRSSLVFGCIGADLCK